jgi:DNA-binding LacI/PurR family transcriptional regulator
LEDGRRVNAKDVALVANVSLSAVSRSFTPGASVSAETRARIMAVADAMGYRPNILARGLTTRRTQLVAVVMPRSDSPFFERFLSKLNHALAAKGQQMLLLLIEARSEADKALEHALDYSVDGLIFFTSAPSPEAANKAANAHVPIVILDKGQGVPHASYVWLDAPGIGRKVAEIFIAEGRTRPLAVAGVTGEPHAKELLEFCAVMEAATGRPTPLIDAEPFYEDGVALAMDMLTAPDRPDAIFTTTDLLALGIHDAARLKLGLDVPGALSIIGHGDTAPTAWLSHRLSTVRPPVDTMCQTAVSTLMAHIADPGLPAINSYIHCDIIRRDTTLPVAPPKVAAQRRRDAPPGRR